MAKIGVHELKYEFECPVCIEPFDETCKMLPCQHTFCIKCLEKLYDFEENPNCPTCRATVLTPISHLQRPILLLNLMEKFKASTDIQEEYDSSKGEYFDTLEISIETYNQRQILESSINEQDDLQMKIALSKSEEAAALETQKENLIAEKEQLEYEIALIKSNKLSESDDNTDPCTSNSLNSVTKIVEPDCIQNNDLCSVSGTTENNLLSVTSVDSTEKDICNFLKNLSISVGDNNSCSFPVDANYPSEVSSSNQPIDTAIVRSIPSCSSSSDASVYEDCFDRPQKYFEDEKNCDSSTIFPIDLTVLTLFGLDLNESELLMIMNTSTDERKMNGLSMNLLSTYINRINDYQSAINSYRSELMKSIFEECCHENADIQQMDERRHFELKNQEDRDLAYCLQLSCQEYFERDEEKALKIAIKNSEKIDPIDEWYAKLDLVKERLELMMVIRLSEFDN